MKQPFFQIAIDGPVAAGKGTVSRLVAEKLGYLYVDTGAMYRCATYLAVKNKVDVEDEAAILPLVIAASIEMFVPTPEQQAQDKRLITVILNGEDVSMAIRDSAISQQVAKVARLSKVREVLVEKQQEIAKTTNVVMEGRDITYKVLPDADLKIFLTASELVRARRRFIQEKERDATIEFADVQQDLIERDALDSSRNTDPLQIVEDAWVIDTSDLSIQGVVDSIIKRVYAMQHSKE